MEIGKIQINTIGEKEQQGGATGGGDSNIEYLDVSGLDAVDENLKNALVLLSPNVKSKTTEGTFVGLPLHGIQLIVGVSNNARTVIALAIDFNTIFKFVIGENAASVNIKDYIMTSEFTQEQLDSIPRITKEQFYTL